MHFIMSAILVPQMNYLGFFLAREWFCVFTLLGNWTLIWIVLDQFWTLLLIRVKAEMYCWGCNAASFWLFCFSLFILKFVLYTLLILRLHTFQFIYLIKKHGFDILTDLRVQMVSGTFLVANLHGDLKQLFVMIRISRDVEILQVVWKFNIQKSNVV